MKKKIIVKVEKQPGEKNFAAYMVDDMPDFGLTGYANSAKAAIEDFKLSMEETREIMEKQGKTMPELECQYEFDLPSYFNYYDCLNVSAVARRAGLNESLMRSYALGLKHPRTQRLEKIKECISNIGRELASPELCAE